MPTQFVLVCLVDRARRCLSAVLPGRAVVRLRRCRASSRSAKGAGLVDRSNGPRYSPVGGVLEPGLESGRQFAAQPRDRSTAIGRKVRHELRGHVYRVAAGAAQGALTRGWERVILPGAEKPPIFDLGAIRRPGVIGQMT